MKDFTKEYRDLCFDFFDATGQINNALRKLPMCIDARVLLELQHEGITQCAQKLRNLQREEMGEKIE